MLYREIIAVCSEIHTFSSRLLCVQWKTPEDGQRKCPKHVEFYSKNIFEKLVHLVGFTTRSHYWVPNFSFLLADGHFSGASPSTVSTPTGASKNDSNKKTYPRSRCPCAIYEGMGEDVGIVPRILNIGTRRFSQHHAPAALSPARVKYGAEWAPAEQL